MVQVEYGMMPPTWNEHRLTGVLNKFDRRMVRPIWSFCFGEHLCEPVDGLGVASWYPQRLLNIAA
jgi:hypothetical protein